jgi:S-adenosylmethionine:tRNA ribosyltransferase-isomerase
LEPFDENEDIIVAMQTTGKVNWKCLIGGAKKWKSGNLEKNISTPNGNVLLQACKKEQSNETGVYVIEFIWNNDSLSFAEILHYAGIIPLPPYLNRETEKEDAVRYQNVYAQKDGSVAAPTAGLHITTHSMNELQQKGRKEVYITLHVGAGTFTTVKANNIAQDEMHAEFIDVQEDTIVHLLQQINAPIVAGGTTSLRTLESLYWIGVKIHEWFQIHLNYNELNDMHVEQWAPYQLNDNCITASEALQAILYWMDAKGTERLITKTSIIIVPGYTFKIIKGLITNFHQPQSTLLLLIAAIIGSEWKKVYQFALNNNFRFLSYGDGSLLWL